MIRTTNESNGQVWHGLNLSIMVSQYILETCSPLGLCSPKIIQGLHGGCRELGEQQKSQVTTHLPFQRPYHSRETDTNKQRQTHVKSGTRTFLYSMFGAYTSSHPLWVVCQLGEWSKNEMIKVNEDTTRVAIGGIAVQMTETCLLQLACAYIKPRTTNLGVPTSSGGWLGDIR